MDAKTALQSVDRGSVAESVRRWVGRTRRVVMGEFLPFCIVT